MSPQSQAGKFHIISLGCSKNTVDSESMSALMQNDGYSGVSTSNDADILIVNTCGFIDSAKRESLDVLQELADSKRDDQILIAAGCLSQRYGSALAQEIQGLDGVIGTRRWMDIVPFLQKLRGRQKREPMYHLPDEAKTVGRDEQGVLRAAIQGASAYLKIADGCRRPCAFCAIPSIKGTLVSRPKDVIIREAQRLQEASIQELIIISQDSTDYGHDLGVRNGLSDLLEDLVFNVPDMPWIRIMYAYPGYVTDQLIETMSNHDQILPYLDIPLQHAHRETLKRMRRPANVDWVHRTVEKLRHKMPEMAIRTTFIVGYPGETDEEFDTLMQFVRDMRFDRVGAFTYSYEASTPSARVSWQVPDDVKEERRQALMELQQQVSLEKNQTFVGKTLPVLVEGFGDGISVGRSYRDAPEIDGLVIVPGDLPVGEILPIRIDGAMAYDLTGYPEGTENLLKPANALELNVIARPTPR
jgi:ribosomal protein S12 methylthiotransferase